MKFHMLTLRSFNNYYVDKVSTEDYIGKSIYETVKYISDNKPPFTY